MTNEIGKLSKLTELNLDKNKLVEFPENLNTIKSLKIITLSANKISTIPNNLNAKYIDLSLNYFEIIPANLLNQNIEYIMFSGNRKKISINQVESNENYVGAIDFRYIELNDEERKILREKFKNAIIIFNNNNLQLYKMKNGQSFEMKTQ